MQEEKAPIIGMTAAGALAAKFVETVSNLKRYIAKEMMAEIWDRSAIFIPVANARQDLLSHGLSPVMKGIALILGMPVIGVLAFRPADPARKLERYIARNTPEQIWELIAEFIPVANARQSW
jgi:hypothetical protein